MFVCQKVCMAGKTIETRILKLCKGVIGLSEFVFEYRAQKMVFSA